MRAKVDISPPDPATLAGGIAFETLLADLSARFVNLRPGEVDREIEDALRSVCTFLDVDLAVLWQWSVGAPEQFTPTHRYSAFDGLPLDEPLSEQDYPWCVQQVRAGRVVYASSLDDLPPKAATDRAMLFRWGVKSAICLPLAVGDNQAVGALGLNVLRGERDWPDALVQRLRLVAEVFANALARQRYEVALQRSRERLNAAAELAGLGYYEVDLSGEAAWVDDRFRTLCGMPAAPLPGLEAVRFWMDHLHPEDRARVMDLRAQMHDGRLEKLSVEYRFLNPVAGELWLHHVAGASQRDAIGRVVRTYGVVRDITLKRRAEEALRASYAEIDRLREKLQAESDYLRNEVNLAYAHGEIVGKSAAVKRVLRQVEQVAPIDSSVLVLGETGTGKELVAQAVHRLSARRGHVLVRVNCAALPSGLVESELFGREKGAYTGALTRQVGRFEIADGSTIFLDEIGELAPELQAKLLRVLDAGELERLGSPKTIKVNVRVIAATNRDLQEEIRQGRFRQDLYYRLGVFPICVPPLRERAEDIPLLVWAFLDEACTRMGKRITQVPRATMDALMRRPWPGNVRELRNVIEHGAIVSTGDTLSLPSFDESRAGAAPPQTLAEAERAHILRVLEQSGWHIKGPAGAAAILGLRPSTLYSRMKKLGIRPRRQTDNGSA